MASPSEAIAAREAAEAAERARIADEERVAREKALPFEPLTPNEPTIAAIREARAGNLKSFATVEDLMADLNAED